MIFKEGTALYSTEVESKQGENVLYVNYLSAPFVPSIADNPIVTARTVDSLIENPNISRIVFVQQRNYNYPSDQILLLSEVAGVYNYLTKEEAILSSEKLSLFGNIPEVHADLIYLLNLIKQDPIACYSELKKRSKGLREQLDKGQVINRSASINYIRFLEKFHGLLENTRLIKSVLGFLIDYRFGSRELYGAIFRPDVLPNFTFTRLIAQLPEKAELIDQYELQDETEKITVTILKKEDDPKYFYHIMPPEYTLTEEHHMLLSLARNVLIEHRPKAEEFIDPERTRQVFLNVSRDLLIELSKSKGIDLTHRELTTLSKVLVRHTIGFGMIEILLLDSRIQDVVINAPIALNPIFIRHEKYDECVTNIIPSYEDADSWAAKLRLQSGRPLDEANPILDTDLVFGQIRARVAAIQQPLSPSGLAYAIRRHRDDPWTLPLFIKNKMINSFTAGLLSFLIDGSRTLLVAGTRSSGKTSLLGSLMLEIMPKYRTIVVEDSVTGDSKIIVKEKDKFKKTTIGELIDRKIKEKGFVDIDGREKEINADNVEVFSVNNKGKVVLSKASKFIRHKVNKPIYEILTTSGKKIKVTGDHSLFGFDEKKILKEVKAKKIKEGNFIAIPYRLPFNNSLSNLNILEDLYKFERDIFIFGNNIGDYIKNNRKKLFGLAYSLGKGKSTIQNWAVKNILPLEIFMKLKDEIRLDNLFIKGDGNSGSMPLSIELDKELLNFIGLWLADGCYDKRSVIISVMEKENKALVRRIASRFNTEVKMHTDGFSSMINSTILKEFMSKILELNGNAYTKHIPSWAYNLSNEQTGWLLQGFYSGDGCASDKEIVFSSCSKDLISDISSLLLRYGIVLRTGDVMGRISKEGYGKDNTISCRIGSTKMINNFKENIGFLVNLKQEKLDFLCSRLSTHDTSDVIPPSLEVKEELSEILKGKFDRSTYIKNSSNLGREHLSNLLSFVPSGITNPIDPLREAVKSDIFWDKVKSVKIVSEGGEYVYDISVPGHENFICENIIAHNTLELPVDSLRKLGYDILRMKVRSALVTGTTEVEAAEGIRTSLRLGDSALIVGEVRSAEAKALYEAMRVGALANVVAGTIHGESPYGIFDRVVNDLNVPTTSFKATDLIIVANPVRTPDGLHSVKRVMGLTEVRKHWTEDPLREGGFVDLLRYNVEKDELEPTPELINGNSEIIKNIAGNVRGWAGNWDAVYDNIIMRGKIKQEIVDAAMKLDRPDLLEAKFNALSNNAFHRISDKVTSEVGLPVSEKVFPEWKKWMNEAVKRI